MERDPDKAESGQDKNSPQNKGLVGTRGILLILLFAVIVLSACWSALRTTPLLADERSHYLQVAALLEGKMLGMTTMLPGYHLLMAGLVLLMGETSVQFLRSWSMIISVLSILVFYGASRAIGGKDSGEDTLRTAQYLFFPIIFPFFCLIYTDILSLLLVMLALFALLKRREVLAGFTGLSSLLTRQTNVVWVGCLFLFLCYNVLASKGSRNPLKEIGKRGWSFLLAFGLFLAFLIVNGGVACGDKGSHPFPSFHLANVYLLLFMFFFLFLPLNVSLFPLVWRRWKVMIGLLILFPIYLATFENTHPYNAARFSLYLRNKILLLFTSSDLWKACFFIPVAYSLLSLSVIRLSRKEFCLLYPATVLLLLPSWLVEPRYYFIPFVLFSLFRPRSSNLVERSTLLIYVVASVFLFWGTARGIFFV